MQAQEKLGPVDMLVNCAGMSISGKFEEMEVDRFKVGATECNPRHKHGLVYFQKPISCSYVLIFTTER